MILHITAAEYLSDYKVALSFNNGRCGVADLADSLDQGVFQPLQDISLFSQLTLDAELQTISWPNGVDLAPEYLYFKAFGDDPALRAQFEAWGYLERAAA
mgnify:CR=1 FL=1